MTKAGPRPFWNRGAGPAREVPLPYTLGVTRWYDASRVQTFAAAGPVTRVRRWLPLAGGPALLNSQADGNNSTELETALGRPAVSVYSATFGNEFAQEAGETLLRGTNGFTSFTWFAVGLMSYYGSTFTGIAATAAVNPNITNMVAPNLMRWALNNVAWDTAFPGALTPPITVCALQVVDAATLTRTTWLNAAAPVSQAYVLPGALLATNARIAGIFTNNQPTRANRSFYNEIQIYTNQAMASARRIELAAWVNARYPSLPALDWS